MENQYGQPRAGTTYYGSAGRRRYGDDGGSGCVGLDIFADWMEPQQQAVMEKAGYWVPAWYGSGLTALRPMRTISAFADIKQESLDDPGFVLLLTFL
jgi:hypothetical protein